MTTQILHAACTNCSADLVSKSYYESCYSDENGLSADNERYLQCNNCYAIKTIKTRKCTTAYIAYNYDNNKIESIKTFSRMTLKRALELMNDANVYYVTECYSNESFTVFAHESSKTIELTKHEIKFNY